jgi:hypothetical protein
MVIFIRFSGSYKGSAFRELIVEISARLVKGSSYGIQKEFNVWVVIINRNCKEGPIPPLIESRTNYYTSRKPEIREYRPYSSLLCNVLRFPVNFLSLRSKYSLQHPVLHVPSIHLLPLTRHIKFLCINLKFSVIYIIFICIFNVVTMPFC